MNAKEYLESIRVLDSKINRKIEQLSALRDVVYKTTSSLTPVPGGDHDPKRKEKLMSKIVDTEAEVDAMIDALADLKTAAIEMIYRMDNLEHCKLLENKYVKLQNWETVAEIMGINSRSVYKASRIALSKFSLIYEEAQRAVKGHHEGSMKTACDDG